MPLVHEPDLKYLHMAGCHQSQFDPFAQVPAIKALHGRLCVFPLGDVPVGDLFLAGDPVLCGDRGCTQLGGFLPSFGEGDLECSGVVYRLPPGDLDGDFLGVEGYLVPPGDILLPPGDLAWCFRPPGVLDLLCPLPFPLPFDRPRFSAACA